VLPDPTVTLDVELISNDRVLAIEVVGDGEVIRRIDLEPGREQETSIEPTFEAARGSRYSSSDSTSTPLLVSTIGIGRPTPGGWFCRW
jgi:hypothetical protein